MAQINEVFLNEMMDDADSANWSAALAMIEEKDRRIDELTKELKELKPYVPFVFDPASVQVRFSIPEIRQLISILEYLPVLSSSLLGQDIMDVLSANVDQLKEALDNHRNILDRETRSILSRSFSTKAEPEEESHGEVESQKKQRPC